MWQISLKEKVEKEKSNILVVDQTYILQDILNVYELPSTMRVISYLHTAVGFPAK